MDTFLKFVAGSLKYFQKLFLIRGTAVASLGLEKVVTQ